MVSRHVCAVLGCMSPLTASTLALMSRDMGLMAMFTALWGDQSHITVHARSWYLVQSLKLYSLETYGFWVDMTNLPG